MFKNKITLKIEDNIIIISKNMSGKDYQKLIDSFNKDVSSKRE